MSATYGPHEYETSPHYRIGYAQSTIVETMRTLQDILDGEALTATETDTWERSYDTGKARIDIARQIRNLRTTLDVLDPTGESPSRKQLGDAA